MVEMQEDRMEIYPPVSQEKEGVNVGTLKRELGTMNLLAGLDIWIFLEIPNSVWGWKIAQASTCAATCKLNFTTIAKEQFDLLCCLI